MNLNIRKASEKDVSQIIELLRDFAEHEKLSDYCEITNEKLLDAMFGEQKIAEGLVCCDGAKMIAYAIFYPCFASFRGQRGVYLEDIYVQPEYRAQGIGEAMIREIARFGAANGAVRIDFQVLEWNAPGIKFYKKLGAEMNAEERHFRFADEAFKKLAR